MDTNKIVITLSIIALLYIATNFVLKLIEIKVKYNLKRDNKKVFLASLYKQERFWSDKGEYDYATCLRILIERFNTPEEEEALTFEGKIAQRELRNQHNED